MVTKRKQHSSPRPVKQGLDARARKPNKIGASTPYNFRGKNLTPYGGLLPVATLLEKLDFQALVEQTLSVKRITRVMSLYQFVLALVLGLYVGFARLNGDWRQGGRCNLSHSRSGLDRNSWGPFAELNE